MSTRRDVAKANALNSTDIEGSSVPATFDDDNGASHSLALNSPSAPSFRLRPTLRPYNPSHPIALRSNFSYELDPPTPEERTEIREGFLKSQASVRERISSFEQRMKDEGEQKRRYSDEFVRLEKNRREAERRRLEEREKRLKVCTACLEKVDKGRMTQLGCTHAYCWSCLKEAVEVALGSRTPFQCCREVVNWKPLRAFLPASIILEYKDLITELTTPNPLYCSNTACHKFIAPRWYKGPDIALCFTCETRTCRHCRQPAHKGICERDDAMQETMRLGQSNGWKECPNCSNLVERESGCLHIRCRCGENFCYRCGKAWEACQSTCPEREALRDLYG